MITSPIVVAGAGPVGLTAALALRLYGHPVTVFDAREPGASDHDPRAVALSHGSRLILERLGAWTTIAATPVRRIVVSQQGGFGRARIDAADHGIDALGHVVRLGALVGALRATVAARGIEIRHGCELAASTAVAAGARVRAGETELDASLVVRAEGGAGANAALTKDYMQTALVTEATPRAGHAGCAHERFTAEGPLALLPLESAMSVVWCMAPGRAARMLALDDTGFIAALDAATRFCGLRWEHVSPRRDYPLTLIRRAADTHAREVALGNAAQSLHPVAGQGLNLGLRDAFELSQALEDGVDGPALERYRRRRRVDRDAIVALTDGYVSLFSNDLAPVRAARGLGLAMVDMLPPLRARIARRMMFGAR